MVSKTFKTCLDGCWRFPRQQKNDSDSYEVEIFDPDPNMEESDWRVQIINRKQKKIKNKKSKNRHGKKQTAT